MTMEIRGIKQIMKNLNALELGLKAENKVIDKSMMPAIKHVRDAIRSKAPVGKSFQGMHGPGELKRGIVTRKKRRHRHRVYILHTFRGQKARTKKGKANILKNDPYYWRFVEYGHFDRSGGKGSKTGRWVPPQKFIRRGFAQSVRPAIKIFRSSFKRLVDVEIARIGRRRAI